MKMKSFTMAMGMVGVGLSVQAQAQNPARTQTTPPAISIAYPGNNYVNTFGVGGQVGDPLGVTAKYWLTENVAFDGAFGLSTYSHSSVEMHVDILFHDFDMVKPSAGQMPVYIGVGLLGRIRTSHHDNLAGFRFPIGVSYMFEDSPFDAFAEIAPEAIFAPFGRIGFDGAIGFRYWFQ